VRVILDTSDRVRDVPPIERSFWLAWTFWCAGQLVVIALFSARVPLAARVPTPVEQWSACAVASTQLILAALLAPSLLATWVTTLRSLSAALPILALASQLSNLPSRPAIAGISLTLLWLATLGLLTRRFAGHGLVAISLATCLLVPALVYFHAEFVGPFLPRVGRIIAAFSPTVGTCSTFLHSRPDWALFVVPVLAWMAEVGIRSKIFHRKSSMNEK
jgi:hypothetical protein